MASDRARGLPLVVGLAVLLGGAGSAWAGHWECSTGYWKAGTTYRRMEGPTRFECGTCGDNSHSRPTSWVDIAGGLSQTCEDHSGSFAGPYSGEWNGCTRDYGGPAIQESFGNQEIQGLTWGNFPQLPWYPGWFSDGYLEQITGTTVWMDPSFASVYDLDTCWMKDIIGTIYYSGFPVTYRLLSGDPSHANGSWSVTWEIIGSTGVHCSDVEPACTSNRVCSDLYVSNYYTCSWNENDNPPCESGQLCY